MEKILTSLFLILSFTSFGQTWQDKVVTNFYSRIDSGKKLECCDKVNRFINLSYVFDTYEMPYNSVREVFEIHYENVIDSSTISMIVDDLVKGYYRIPKKIRKKFNKTCYDIDTKTQVTESSRGELVFGEGKVYLFLVFNQTKHIKDLY